ncbi:MAG TPA: MBL fold metallo-hydrolase [Clostridiales bacterium]|nr:MBL fold metallo-hydrolase [Clostridiales bacterium]
MKVTFIHHSSFFVQQEHACFLFDYWTGPLPKPLDVPLFIFVSHGHGDHFNPDVLEYGKQWENVHFVLSDDIDPECVPGSLMPYVTIASPDSKYTVSSGGTEISFSTLRSTDIGNAYLIHSGNKTLYHAGDLNLWLWRENLQEDKNMQAAFEKEMEKLRGLTIDAAFLPLDPRQGRDAFLGLDYTARLADIKRIYPMHCWQKLNIIIELLADPCSEPYRDRICPIRKDGYTDEI